jgi:hypothetical protein
VWVPDAGHEAMRDLVRARLDAVHALRRARQQLSGFMLRQGCHYGRPALGISATDVISVVWRPLVASLLAAAVGFTLGFTILADMSGISRIIVMIALYIIVYLTIVDPFVFGRRRKEVSGSRNPRAALRAPLYASRLEPLEASRPGDFGWTWLLFTRRADDQPSPPKMRRRTG